VFLLSVVMSVGHVPAATEAHHQVEEDPEQRDVLTSDP
jgi:hypothetical protein